MNNVGTNCVRLITFFINKIASLYIKREAVFDYVAFLAQELCHLKCRIYVAVNCEFAGCECNNRVEFAVDELDPVCAVDVNNSISVIIFIRLNMYLTVFYFYVKNAVDCFAFNVNLKSHCTLYV